ncbi:MAG: Lrp/AsnC family transcriptional regulator [Dehalococcoidales bacterium]|nr:Lrp/AsnC family transcriptional regulator [Dehalococcoidales bacterium]
MIDELDQKLILALQEDGRLSFSALGKLLGVSEGTIRQRYKKITKSGLFKTVGVPNIEKVGYGFVSIVAIQVMMAKLEEVREKLSHDPAVCQLFWTTGRYDLIAVVVTKSADEFANFMLGAHSMTPHIVRTETFVSLGTVKGLVSLPDTIELIRRLDISPRKKKGSHPK